MPPRVKFAQELVLKEAYKLVQANGLNSLTARAVAKELNSSVAPLYSYYESIEDLKYAVIRKASLLLKNYTRQQYTNDSLLNIGVGFVIFAREHRHLYRSMFLECADYSELVVEFRAEARDQLKKEDRFLLLGEAEVEEMFIHLWTYAHGLAALICAGLIQDVNNDEIIKRLEWTGEVIAKATLLEANQQ